MAHFCPGLHGPGCDHDCECLSFRAFFEAARSGRRQLIIPLFQRRYCWPRAMLEAWWRDATTGRGHRVGTVFTKDRDGARMVIDGQQRLTTAMLLVAALRDAALELLRRGDTASTGAEAFVLNAFVESLEAALYVDGGGGCSLPQWVHSTASSLISGGRNWAAVHPVGAQFGLALLQPSFVDRAPFFELITAGRVRHACSLLTERPPADRVSLSGPPPPESLSGPCPDLRGAANGDVADVEVCAKTRGSLLAAAKQFFDEAVAADLRRWRMGGTGAQIARLQQLGQGALDALTLQSVSIVNPINYTQVRRGIVGGGGVRNTNTPTLYVSIYSAPIIIISRSDAAAVRPFDPRRCAPGIVRCVTSLRGLRRSSCTCRRKTSSAAWRWRRRQGRRRSPRCCRWRCRRAPGRAMCWRWKCWGAGRCWRSRCQQAPSLGIGSRSCCPRRRHRQGKIHRVEPKFGPTSGLE